MILGVISDTHDRLEQLDAALCFFRTQGVTTVVHCGDWKSIETVQFCAERAAELALEVRGVLGNNDLAVQEFLAYAGTAPGSFELTEGVWEFTMEGKRVAAYHGHHAPTKRRLLAAGYDLVLLGHSHKPLIEHMGPTLVVNPGSTAFAIPRNKAWHPSVAIVDIPSMEPAIHYLG